VVLTTAIAALFYVSGLSISVAQTACPNPIPSQIPPPNLNAPAATLVPSDACIPSPVPGGIPIAYFDDYSWRAFIALVWPALGGKRGVADTGQKLSATGTPLVFETYKADWETFQPDGSPPSPWDSADFVKAPCAAAKPGDFVLGSFSKFGNVGEAGIGDLAFVLIAQNGTFVRYLAAYNQAEFNEIVAHKWYLASNLPQNQTPPGSPITFPAGSIDIKSSWIDMTNMPHPERYHTRNAWLLDPITGQCSTQPMSVGLVGLHIVQKTPTRPQWIWSTFEQVDNVPPPGYVPPAPPAKPTQSFAFNDGTMTQMPPNPPKEYVWQTAATAKSAPPPLNIQRLTPINNDPSVSRNTVATNAIWQQALQAEGSVWQFYQLTMTQWPIAPNQPNNSGGIANTFPGSIDASSAFANTTLETWDQTKIRNGCMNCHTQTQVNDFVWSLQMNAFKSAAPSLSPGANARMAPRQSPQINALRIILEDQFK
jgi:hypothetical protein